MKKSEKFIIGTIVGGAIGSVLGLLFAPKPGKETRHNVAEASKKAVTWSKKQADKLHKEHGDELDEAVDMLQKSTKKLKASFKSLKRRTVDPAVEKLIKTRQEEGSDR